MFNMAHHAPGYVLGLIGLQLLLQGCVSSLESVCTPGTTIGPTCQCTDPQQGKITVVCQGQRLTAIPSCDRIPISTNILILSTNSISEIADSALFRTVALERLYLQINRISRIEKNAFRNLHKLERLYLAGNNLTSLSQATFQHLYSLKVLDLEGNRITSISGETLVPLSNLNELRLNSNQLHCDCEMKIFREWLLHKKDIISTSFSLTVTGAECATCANGSACVGDLRILFANPSVFGSCPHKPMEQYCFTCVDQKSDLACSRREKCATEKHMCQTSLAITNRDWRLEKGCETEARCKALPVGPLCQPDLPVDTCSSCCNGHLCNSGSMLQNVSQTVVLDGRMQLRIPVYSYEGLGRNSSYPPTLTEKIRLKATEALSNVRGSHTVHVNITSDESMAVFTVDSLVLATEKRTVMRDVVYKALVASAYNGAMRDLNLIIRDSIFVTAQGLCPAEMMATAKGMFYWPSTEAGLTVTLDCPVQRAGEGKVSATRLCTTLGILTLWDEPDMDQCSYSSKRTEDLSKLAQVPVTSSNADHVARNLSMISQDASDYDILDVVFTVRIIDNLLQPGVKISAELAAVSMIQVISDLLEVHETVLQHSQEVSRSSSKLVEAIDNLAANIIMTENETRIVKNNLAITLVKEGSVVDSGLLFGTRANTGRHNLAEKDVMLIYNSSGAHADMTDTAISLPPSLFTQVPAALRSRIQFVIYQKNILFKAIDDSRKNDTQQPTQTSEIKDGRPGVNSRVISASFGNTKIENLKDPITLSFKQLQTRHVNNSQCVFWNMARQSWTSEGCTLITTTAGKQSICKCNHLTNFALIMDIFGSVGKYGGAYSRALSIVSIVGCSISMLALATTITTYLVFPKLRRDNPSKILINLCLALFAVNLIFVTGTHHGRNDAACKVVAAMLHYFLLSAFCWMAVEAFYMYVALVQVFNTYYSKFLLKICLVGWGVPAIVTAITLAISLENYGLSQGICWLTRPAFYAAFLGPVGAILILNFIAFALVIRSLRSLAAKNLTKTSNGNTTSQLRRAVSVVVLLGLTWSFALFQIDKAAIVFSFLFTICNSLQGLFVFVFYCALKKDVQQAWAKACLCFTDASQASLSKSTSKGETNSTDLSEDRGRNRLKATVLAFTAAWRIRKNDMEQKVAAPISASNMEEPKCDRSSPDYKKEAHHAQYMNDGFQNDSSDL